MDNTLKIIFFLSILAFNLNAGAQTKDSLKLRERHVQRVMQSAQKGTVVLSMDTIFNKGIPYAILKTKKSLSGDDYTLYGLNGTELIYIPCLWAEDPTFVGGKSSYHLFYFIGTGAKAEVRGDVTLSIPKLIVQSDLVLNDAVNPAAETRFLLKNPQVMSLPRTSLLEELIVNFLKTDVMAERNRNVPVIVIGNELKQENKKIGSYTMSMGLENGSHVKVFSFFSVSGRKVADAVQTSPTSDTYLLKTLKDGRQNSFGTTLGMEAQMLAEFLSKNYYL